MPDRDIYWTIHTELHGAVIADHVYGDELPTVTPGSDVTIRFRFSDTGASSHPPRDRHESLLEYLDYAAAVTTFTSLDATPYYRETPADGTSLLMGFEPGPDSQSSGFWGVVTGGRDASSANGAVPRLEFDVFILDEFTEYPDRAAVATAREL